MENDCMLCCQAESFVGLGECSHGPICYKCCYKMRLISKNEACPVCKTESKIVVITTETKDFQLFDQKKLLPSKQFPGFLFETQKALDLFGKLTETRCFVPNCDDQKTFSTIALLKKHLKERHNRFFCDICLEYKTCVLEEHKIYSSKALDRHMRKGDVDESQNIVFMHPYCKFCNIYMFDEDFLKKHVEKQHFKCILCPEKYKYYQYKNYKSLETHFRMTHYLCPDPDCLAKCFIAFKKSSDLMAHRYMVHEKTQDRKPADMTAVAGFYTEGSKMEHEQIKFQDKEGLDFEAEYLSLKRTNMRALLEVVDQHKDEQFDFRIFQRQRYDHQEMFEQAFEKVKKSKPQVQQPQGKKKYKVKGQNTNKQGQSGEQKTVYRDSISSFKTVKSPLVEYKDFEQKLHMIFDQTQYDKFSELKHLYNKNKLKAEEFIASYFKLFSAENLTTAYNVWPQFIRTIQNQDTRIELDRVYLEALRKLPARVDNLLNASQRYSDFFNKLLNIVEEQIKSKIENGQLNIRKKVKMDKERIFQMIEVIRHIRTSEMARLKFSTNFGISPDTMHSIESKLYSAPLTEASVHLDRINEFELLNLYLYVKFCKNALCGKDIHLERRFIKQEILEDFLEANPELMMKYGKRKQSMTLDEQAQFEDEQEKKTKEKVLNKLAGFQKKTHIIDKDDKYEFPELGDRKKAPKQKVDKSRTQLTSEQFKETFVYQSKKPATLQKNINDFFPTLGDDNPKQKKLEGKAETIKTEPSKSEPTLSQPEPVEEKKKKSNWWAKVDGHDDKPVQQGKIQGEIRREKKKKKEIIFVQGGFK